MVYNRASLFQPSTWRPAVTRNRAVWWLIGFASAICCVGWTPLPNSLLAKFEYAYSAPKAGLDAFVGVVVLGGNGRPIYAGVTQEQVELFSVTDRMVYAVQLAREHPKFRLLYTNGSSMKKRALPLVDHTSSQSTRFFITSGIEDVRLVFERSATNTRENAIFSADLNDVDIKQPWLLLTSAAHMPRAMATFKAVGWNVTAYPVDYKTKMALPWWDFSLSDGAALWQNFLYELFALAKYRTLKWV